MSKQLSELEIKVSTTPTPDSVEEYYVVKNQLNSLYDDIAAGALIRSRCTHINEHEKPTSYFLNGKSKHIRTLNFGGERISDPQKILDVRRQYFFKFYSQPAETEANDKDMTKYLDNIDIPCISDESKLLCDLPLTITEIEKAIKCMANNKTPGPDGIPVEFYKIFWSEVSSLVHESFQKAYELRQLSDSQRQGVINLIPKKDKDLTELKSWRPDQIGYMKNRFCGENTRLIADVMEFCKIKNSSCIILLVDFEKAFDTVNWSLLNKTIIRYGFGKSFRKWLSILYKNSESCVKNNEHVSSFFKLSKGIRQGCPISALLFC